jgi:hypothetical protein
MAEGATAVAARQNEEMCEAARAAGLACAPPLTAESASSTRALSMAPAFDRRAFRTTADCLTAAYAGHVPLGTCER